MTRRRRKGFAVLGESELGMTRRFGAPNRVTEDVLTWYDGVDEETRIELRCLLNAEGVVHTTRIGFSGARRMRTDELYRWVARYNGGHVQGPEELPHSFGGGVKCISFREGFWAFPQRDEVGGIYAIKIWQEQPSSVAPSDARSPEPVTNDEGDELDEDESDEHAP